MLRNPMCKASDNTVEISEFEKEAWSTVERIRPMGVYFQESQWFMDTMLRRFDPRALHAVKPSVVALGDDLPGELLLAFAENPFYVLGGSLGAAHWAEGVTPRDTDPVSRSSLGMLQNPEFDLAENALIVTAASSDSRRKLAAMLADAGRQVAVLDVPPSRQDPSAVSKYTAQLRRLVEMMERHTGVRLTYQRLREACIAAADARRELRLFLKITLGLEQVLSAPLRMLIVQSLYAADNIMEWKWKLARLNNAIRGFKDRCYMPDDGYPRVMVLGSPVLFPNYKLPFLIENAHMHVGLAVDPASVPASLPMEAPGRFGTVNGLLEEIAGRQLRRDMSAAYTSNDVLLRNTGELLEYSMIEGVVFHVLKGQIEYDFELPRLERIAESLNVPVFRLETDYQYQDVEQLRIRMEAFSEVLAQRRYGNVRRAR